MKIDILNNKEDIDNKPLTFGKYKDNTPNQVAVDDPQYIVWMYDNLDYKHCTEELRDDCEEAASIEMEYEYEKGMDDDFGLDGWGDR